MQSSPSFRCSRARHKRLIRWTTTPSGSGQTRSSRRTDAGCTADHGTSPGRSGSRAPTTSVPAVLPASTASPTPVRVIGLHNGSTRQEGTGSLRFHDPSADYEDVSALGDVHGHCDAEKYGIGVPSHRGAPEDRDYHGHFANGSLVTGNAWRMHALEVSPGHFQRLDGYFHDDGDTFAGRVYAQSGDDTFRGAFVVEN